MKKSAFFSLILFTPFLFAASFETTGIYKIPLKTFMLYKKGNLSLDELKKSGSAISRSELEKELKNAYVVKKIVKKVLFLHKSSGLTVNGGYLMSKNTSVMKKTVKNNDNIIKLQHLSLQTLARYALFNYNKLTNQTRNRISYFLLMKIKENPQLDYLAIASYLKVHGLTKEFLKEFLNTLKFLSKQGLL